MTRQEQQRIRDALGRLGEVLADIVSTAEEKNRERCGYRAASSACTFIGGCLNQREDRCGGDDFVRQHFQKDPS